ncbi:hypothetical protein L249_6686 [Ophiocordyceps polyrhachis-furcata BCC 54312]|uniref:RNA helicase n=1 Tax=Ophiocordyceps polyrhachis-furcata BCC 54312 TaxID=1330021 RepID=A0A367LK41_9HYPO|nr:hypothetical protein L249_6686 [Ophiocordyceps polyrhachis-furcata BCC 54312]
MPSPISKPPAKDDWIYTLSDRDEPESECETHASFNSDFEFVDDPVDPTGPGDDDLQDWGFEGAKKGTQVPEQSVGLDGIIKRRREKLTGLDGSGSQDGQEAMEGATFTMDDDDDDDEVLADDGQDLEEQAKRDAFFAPEEAVQHTVKKTRGQASSFVALGLSRPIVLGTTAVGFSTPTPIQAKAIPFALLGKDLVGGAQTGSGKTGAFIIPILERLLYRPNKVPTTRVVVLAPTRELAIQCHSVAIKLASYTDIKFSLAVGGLSLKMQEAELRRRPDVVIATPGRFIDHMRNSASFKIDKVEILVLDEADRMLAEGFADELDEILSTLPKARQTMLFSATMTSTVDRLIRLGMSQPVRLMVDALTQTVSTLVQEIVRLRPKREDKRMGYLVHLCKKLYTERVIIFFRQKTVAHHARIVFGLLGLSCAELHGNIKQRERIENMEAFRDGKVAFLLTTDLASRGLDIRKIDTVINYDAPQTLENYVHRVGRTARAGRKGTAVTLAAEADRKLVKAIAKAGKARGTTVTSRLVAASDADKWQRRVDELSEEVESVIEEEKHLKEVQQAEMHIKKAENLLVHKAEIQARPKRTWFQTEQDKQKSRQVELDGLDALRKKLKKKSGGKLSNKDKKKLEARAFRSGVVKKRGSVGGKGRK